MIGLVLAVAATTEANDINWNIWIPLFISACSGGYAYLSARSTNKTTLNKANEEIKVDISKTNNEQSIALFQQYQKMNEVLQERFNRLQEKLDEMEKEFRVFRVETEKEKAFLMEQIDVLEDLNEDLVKENTVLKVENGMLKEEINSGKF